MKRISLPTPISFPVLLLLHVLLLSDVGASEVKDFGVAESLLSSINEAATTPDVKFGKIGSVLNKLGKNLILEGTRGPKEIALYQKASSSVVLVLTDDGLGSGVLIDSEGYVLTNWHVVGNFRNVVVVFKPRDSVELKKELAFLAGVEKIDQVADLALLKIIAPPKQISFLGLAHPGSIAVGQDVHAIGHPEGEVWTYTKGIISQVRKGYKWSTSDGNVHQANVIQTQTPINPGNSGGPLLDDSGNLIGINSFRSQGEGLNYALAVDVLQEFRNCSTPPWESRRLG